MHSGDDTAQTESYEHAYKKQNALYYVSAEHTRWYVESINARRPTLVEKHIIYDSTATM